MPNHRLKNAKEIAEYRDLALKKQKNLDPITGLLILKPALDHDHATGKIRGVLDIRSNSWEGKVKNSLIGQRTRNASSKTGKPKKLELKRLELKKR